MAKAYNLKSIYSTDGSDDPLAAVPDDIRPLLPGFLERREKELHELQQLLSAEEFLSIKNIGHRLKGTGGGFGLPIFSDIGRDLESAAEARDTDKIVELIGFMTSIVQYLRQQYALSIRQQ